VDAVRGDQHVAGCRLGTVGEHRPYAVRVLLEADDAVSVSHGVRPEPGAHRVKQYALQPAAV